MDIFDVVFVRICKAGCDSARGVLRVGAATSGCVCVFSFLIWSFILCNFWGGLVACVYFWVAFPPEFRGREMRKCWLLDDVRLWWKGSLITQMCRINTCI